MTQTRTSELVSQLGEAKRGPSRRHDLDALRAAAMLLGIAYHGALSFSLGFGWMVQDISQSTGLYIFQSFVHGFRMPLFMLVSGFFTAMLWRKKGLRAMLWHRFRRVFLPCLAALITVIPAMKWSVGYANEVSNAKRKKSRENIIATESVWGAINKEDFNALQAHLEHPKVVTSLHPAFQLTALSWASLVGHAAIVGALLDRGADVNWRSKEGHTALHGAAFLGRYEVADLLISRGADINAKSFKGELPTQSAAVDYSKAAFIAGLLGIELNKEQVLRGREKILKKLNELGAENVAPEAVNTANNFKKIVEQLLTFPVFGVVWFLWFLVWLVLIFSIYAFSAERFGWKTPSHSLIISQRNLIWLVPLTILPTWLMRLGNGAFGPDTSTSIIPTPHVLAYYALFFGFGVLYFDSDDAHGKLGRAWRWTFPISLFLVFPIALEFATGALGFRNKLLPAIYHRPVSVVFQASYAWMMSFAWIGIFRSCLSEESKRIRYISDASYWFYLLHLPLVIATQAFVCEWALPASLKFLMVTLFVSLILLTTYDKLVRYSFIGSFLNGRRPRQEASHSTVHTHA